MKVFLNKKELDENHFMDNENILCFAKEEQANQILEMLQLEHLHISESSGSRFESRNGFDYISLSVPDKNDIMAPPGKVEIYFTSGKLLFFHNKVPVIHSVIEKIMEKRKEIQSLGKALYLFFYKLTENDAGFLEKIEEEIADLEDSLANGKQLEYPSEISLLRKRLLVLKRYYEGLNDLLEDLEENQNNLLEGEDIRTFRLQTNRAERLYRSVLNLRDYVTQVREAYQSQVDISLNKTMQFFTVITTIFLPLTLLVGWYGMNFHMPEYEMDYAYPIVIIVSAFVVVGSILYFKKNKWF